MLSDQDKRDINQMLELLLTDEERKQEEEEIIRAQIRIETRRGQRLRQHARDCLRWLTPFALILLAALIGLLCHLLLL